MSEWMGASWEAMGFVALTTAALYFSILLGTRVAGRRTLAQLSAFDAVITIALGSMLANAALSRDTSYSEGLVAVGTLLVLQVILGALRRRFPLVRKAVDFEPVALVEEGVEQPRSGLLGAQITDGEFRSALRTKGVFDPSEVDRCVLEPTGEISVLRRSDTG